MRDATRFRLLGLMPRPLRQRLMRRRYEAALDGAGEPELRELPKFVKRGDLALDVGCNVGVYAWALGRLTGRVIAFEPNPGPASLVRGMALEGVELRQEALADEDGEAMLSVPGVSGGHGLGSLHAGVVEEAGAERVAVPTRKLDSLGLDRVSFIKIDVEGHEEAVLEGAVKTIERDHPTLLIEIEERHNPGGLARISQRLGAFGYKGSFLDRGTWASVEGFDPALHQPGDPQALHGGARKDVRYINNFLFTPAGHA